VSALRLLVLSHEWGNSTHVSVTSETCRRWRVLLA
jgi:hypothetical protein